MRSVVMTIAAAGLAILAERGSAQGAGLISSLERLAHTGNAEAIYHLGMAFQTGSGVPKDHGKALEAFRKATSLGDPLASYKLGCYYAGQGGTLVSADIDLALRYKLVAARAGYALAQQDVGILYAQRGDLPTGLTWLEKSAAQGWSGGLMTLASVYNGAFGIKPDPAKTFAYFRLFLSRSEHDEDQVAWLKAFGERLSPEDKKRSYDIVSAYHPIPSLLTLKALSGQRAAEALIEASSRR